MESHTNLILRGVGERVNLAYRRGGEARAIKPFEGPGKLSIDHGRCWRHDHLGRHAHLRLSIGGGFFPYQLPPTQCAEVTHLASLSNELWGVSGRRGQAMMAYPNWVTCGGALMAECLLTFCGGYSRKW